MHQHTQCRPSITPPAHSRGPGAPTLRPLTALLRMGVLPEFAGCSPVVRAGLIRPARCPPCRRDLRFLPHAASTLGQGTAAMRVALANENRHLVAMTHCCRRSPNSAHLRSVAGTGGRSSPLAHPVPDQVAEAGPPPTRSPKPVRRATLAHAFGALSPTSDSRRAHHVPGAHCESELRCRR